jgi:hypothetical protein
MPFQAVPDCAQAVIRCNRNSQEMVNILHFYHPLGYTQSDLDALAAAVDSQVGAHYIHSMAPSVGYLSTDVKGLALVNDLTSIDSTSVGSGDMSGVDNLPSNVTWVATLRSAYTGRSARGRFYTMPFTDLGLASINAVTSTFATSVITFLNDVVAQALLAGWTMVVVSRFHNKAPRTTGIYFPITNITARNYLTDSQRGRLTRGH